MYTFDTCAPYIMKRVKCMKHAVYQVSIKQFLKITSAAYGVASIVLANCFFVIQSSNLPGFSHDSHEFGYGFRYLSAFTVMADRGISLMGKGSFYCID